MADPQQKPKSSEVMPSVTPEVAPEAVPESHTAQRIEVAGTVTAQKSREYLNVEKLKKGDFELLAQEPEIRQIDVKESAEKQRPLMEELAGTAMFELIPHLLSKGIPKEKIENFDVFRHPPENLDLFLTVPNAQGTLDLKAAFQKVQEALNGPRGEGTVATVLEENWMKMVALGVQAQEIAAEYVEAAEGTKPRTHTERKPKGFLEKYGNGILIGLGLVAGAYVCTSIWNKFTATDEEKAAERAKEPTGFFSKLFKGIAGVGILGAVFAGLGRLTESERVRKWLRNFGFDDTKLIEAFRLLSHGKFGEAWDKFMEMFSDNPEKSTYEKIAEKINGAITGADVQSDNIQKISDIKFRAWFPKTSSEQAAKSVSDALHAGAQYLIPKDGFIASFIRDDPQLVKDMQSIEKFIKLPANKQRIAEINPGPTMTMKEVLEDLCKVDTKDAQSKQRLPEAAVAVAGGAVGAAAHEAAERQNTMITTHHQEILTEIDTTHTLSEDSIDLMTDDVRDLIGVVEQAQGESTSWWQREKGLLKKVIGAKVGVEYEEEDFAALNAQLDDLANVDTLTLQDIRTQGSTLRQHLQDLERPVTAEKAAEIRQEIDDFYTNYQDLQALLEEVRQKRIAEERGGEHGEKDVAWVFEKGVATGTLVLNTFLGMPFSVALGEDNGKLVAIVGGVQLGLFAMGAAKGLMGTHGGIMRAGVEGTKWAAAPVWYGAKYGTKYGFRISRGVAEKLKLYEANTIMRQVQRGELTVAEGMAKIKTYLNAHGLEYVREAGKDSRIADRAGNLRQTWRERFWGTHKLNTTEAEQLKKDMDALEKLALQGVRILGEFRPEEEKLIAAEIENIRTRVGSTGSADEVALRQLAIESLQTGGKIRSLESLATSLEAASTRLPTLREHGEKIAALSEASREADNYLEMSIAHIKKLRAEGRPDAEIEAFTTTVQANLRKLRDQFGITFGALNAQTKTMSKVDRKAFEKLATQELANATGVRALKREIKGRGKWALAFGFANIVLETYAITKENKEDHVKNEFCKIAKEVGLDTAQLVLDILCPFGLSDWYTVVSGKQLLTQKHVGLGERLTRVVFGTYNATTDILALLATPETAGAGGVAVYAAENAIETGLRAAGKGPAVAAAVKGILPRLVALAKDVGGFKNLLQIAKSKPVIDALRTTRTVAGGVQMGMLAYDAGRMAIAGYEIFFDTKDQPVYEMEMGALDEEPPASEPLQAAA